MVEFTAKDFVQKEGKVFWNNTGTKSEAITKRLPGLTWRTRIYIKETNIFQFWNLLSFDEITIETTLGAQSLHIINQNLVLLEGGVKIDLVHPEPEDFNEACKQVNKPYILTLYISYAMLFHLILYFLICLLVEI